MAAPVLAPAQAPVLRHSIYWRETEPVEPGPPLEGEVRCDVCIIGGGYTGLWTAHFLNEAEPSLDIHVLESEYAGAGASGHADGFITPTIGHSLHTVVRGWGPERAKAGFAAVGRSILELRRFCRKQGIDAELEPNGFYLVATNDGQRRRLDHDVELAAAMGVAYEVLDRDDAQDRIGAPPIQAALKTPGALVNPHRLARGLCRAVRSRGVDVHEQTRALSVERTPRGHVVTTHLGRVVADRVVYATNAYQHQWPAYRSQVKPVWSYALVSEPLTPEQLELVHWPDREGFVEARNFISFGRLTGDNRLLIGGGPAPYHYGRDMDERHIRNDQVKAFLAAELPRYFPAWRDLRWTHSYGGCIAVTRDFVPRVGSNGDGTYHAYGYCGNGIAMTHTASKAMRDVILERDTDFSRLLFVGGKEPAFPPEPLAFAGARVLSAALDWQDRHPDAIRRQFV